MATPINPDGTISYPPPELLVHVSQMLGDTYKCELFVDGVLDENATRSGLVADDINKYTDSVTARYGIIPTCTGIPNTSFTIN